MAVLPTPGSPISTGLFLVRRDSTWTTRRISSSRPITGSSFPARAASTRSRPYLASASMPPSAASLSTVRPLRISVIALASPALVTCCNAQARATARTSSNAMNRRSAASLPSPAWRASARALVTTRSVSGAIGGCSGAGD